MVPYVQVSATHSITHFPLIVIFFPCLPLALSIYSQTESNKRILYICIIWGLSICATLSFVDQCKHPLGYCEMSCCLKSVSHHEHRVYKILCQVLCFKNIPWDMCSFPLQCCKNFKMACLQIQIKMCNKNTNKCIIKISTQLSSPLWLGCLWFYMLKRDSFPKHLHLHFDSCNPIGWSVSCVSL